MFSLIVPQNGGSYGLDQRRNFLAVWNVPAGDFEHHHPGGVVAPIHGRRFTKGRLDGNQL